MTNGTEIIETKNTDNKIPFFARAKGANPIIINDRPAAIIIPARLVTDVTQKVLLHS